MVLCRQNTNYDKQVAIELQNRDYQQMTLMFCINIAILATLGDSLLLKTSCNNNIIIKFISNIVNWIHNNYAAYFAVGISAKTHLEQEISPISFFV